jgi:hypothetical protein
MLTSDLLEVSSGAERTPRFFGLLFRRICSRGFVHPFWWGVAPFILFNATEAEDGLYEVLNWVIKSCFVALVIYFVFPEIRAAPQGRINQNRYFGIPESCCAP